MKIVQKMKASLAVLEAGKRVNNPKAWKTGQISQSAVAALIAALAAAIPLFTDVSIQIDETQISELAAGLIAVVAGVFSVFNIVSTTVSTDKVGLSKRNNSDDT